MVGSSPMVPLTAAMVYMGSWDNSLDAIYAYVLYSCIVRAKKLSYCRHVPPKCDL